PVCLLRSGAKSLAVLLVRGSSSRERLAYEFRLRTDPSPNPQTWCIAVIDYAPPFHAIVTVYPVGVASLVITRKHAGEHQMVCPVLSWQALQHAFASARKCTGAQFHDWVLEIAFVG